MPNSESCAVIYFSTAYSTAYCTPYIFVAVVILCVSLAVFLKIQHVWEASWGFAPSAIKSCPVRHPPPPHHGTTNFGILYDNLIKKIS